MTTQRKDEIKTDSEKLDLIYQWVMKQNQFREPTKKVNPLPFEVAESDAGTMNWHDAMNCGKDGWRLPTSDELNLIFKNKEQFKGLVRIRPVGTGLPRPTTASTAMRESSASATGLSTTTIRASACPSVLCGAESFNHLIILRKET